MRRAGFIMQFPLCRTILLTIIIFPLWTAAQVWKYGLTVTALGNCRRSRQWMRRRITATGMALTYKMHMKWTSGTAQKWSGKKVKAARERMRQDRMHPDIMPGCRQEWKLCRKRTMFCLNRTKLPHPRFIRVIKMGCSMTLLMKKCISDRKRMRRKRRNRMTGPPLQISASRTMRWERAGRKQNTRITSLQSGL